MNDLQKFLNDFLDFSNRTVLFTTMIILIVILIALVSFIRKKKKKKKLSTESSDGTEFNEDFNKENQDDSAAEGLTEDDTDFSKDFSKDDSAVEGNTDFSDSTIAEENQDDSAVEGNTDFSDSTIAEENQDDSAAEGLTELNEDFNKDDSVVEDLTEEDFSKEDFSKEDSAESFNKKSSDDKDFSKDESSEDEMEALLSEEDNDDLYSAEMIENFFGNLGKQEIGNAKGVVEEIKKKAELQEKEEVELQEKKEAPVELILHDQISVDEKEPEEVNKEEEEEEKHTAITLIDGSDRVMVSIGEKFEAKHTKDFTIEVKDEPEITIAMQDGFVFDGRIHFFVSLSEALAKHITLKDVTEITGPKGSYSGYEIKLEVTDKGDLESIDCTRSFNYKKVKDAVLIIQLSLE